MGLWDQILARTVAIVKQGGTATHCKYGSRLTPKIFSKIHKNKYIQKVVSLQKFTKIDICCLFNMRLGSSQPYRLLNGR
jgi:hypothetical protein